MKQRAFITLTFAVDLDQVPGFGHGAEDWERVAINELTRNGHYNPEVTIHRTEVKGYEWNDNPVYPDESRWIRPQASGIEIPEGQHRLIGMSLSLCVKDIIEGRVAFERVEKIWAGTCCRTAEDWQRLWESYRDTYWRKHADKAAEVFQRLLRADKIDQPRTRGAEPQTIHAGHWRAA